MVDRGERVNMVLEPGTREKLLELAGGERKLGEYVSALVREDYERRTLSLSDLAERIDELGSVVAKIENSFWPGDPYERDDDFALFGESPNTPLWSVLKEHDDLFWGDEAGVLARLRRIEQHLGLEPVGKLWGERIFTAEAVRRVLGPYDEDDEDGSQA